MKPGDRFRRTRVDGVHLNVSPDDVIEIETEPFPTSLLRGQKVQQVRYRFVEGPRAGELGQSGAAHIDSDYTRVTGSPADG